MTDPHDRAPSPFASIAELEAEVARLRDESARRLKVGDDVAHHLANALNQVSDMRAERDRLQQQLAAARAVLEPSHETICLIADAVSDADVLEDGCIDANDAARRVVVRLRTALRALTDSGPTVEPPAVQASPETIAAVSQMTRSLPKDSGPVRHGDGGTPVSPPAREDGRERNLHRPTWTGGKHAKGKSAGPCDRDDSDAGRGGPEAGAISQSPSAESRLSGAEPGASAGGGTGATSVPRGHCNRCSRCGFPLAGVDGKGCWLTNCSMRPMPEPRSHCAGCGAPFVNEQPITRKG